MATKLGLECKLYRNTGTYGTPVWDLISNAQDVTVTLEKGEADLSVRGSTWRARRSTLKDATMDFTMLYDSADADFTAMKDSYINGTEVDVVALDGLSSVAGSQGLRVTGEVFTLTRNEPLEEGLTVPISIRPGPTNAPAWTTTV
jgi:hypothetical protein